MLSKLRLHIAAGMAAVIVDAVGVLVNVSTPSSTIVVLPAALTMNRNLL